MGGYQTFAEDTDALSCRVGLFDVLIEWLVVALLSFMPFAFGAVQAWSEQVVIAICGAIALCFLLKALFERPVMLLWSWAYVPIAIFLLVVLVQLVPLPPALLGLVSPQTLDVKSRLVGDLLSRGGSDWMALSFYPYATKRSLRLMLAVACVFVVVLNVIRRPAQIKRALTAIAVIGGAVAILALIQDIFGNGKIYWVVSIPGPANSGPFVNHSHFSQFMNLSIGAAVAAAIVRFRENFRDVGFTMANVFGYLSCGSSAVFWALTAIVVLGATTIFLSLSRGGMFSMLLAAALTTLALARRRSFKDHGWILVLIALGAFACVLHIGFDAVYERLASLRDPSGYRHRWVILTGLWRSFMRFPLVGTGLGTHSVVYPMFDRSNIPALATHAENEYAQVVEETGLIGLCSLVVFGVIICVSCLRNIRVRRPIICSASYGLGFGLIAILAHSMTDFGQHLPANAFLSAIFCAILLGLARTNVQDNCGRRIFVPGLKFRLAGAVALVCVCGLWLWSLRDANNYRLAEARWQTVLDGERRLVERNWQGTDSEYAELIRHAAAACDYEPENIEYRYWLNVYRWRSISRLRDADTEAVIIDDDSMSVVNDIVLNLDRARLLCPTFGATYCVLGQLEFFILDDPGGAEKIRNGFRLAPCDATACFVAGVLDVTQGRVQTSFDKLSKAVILNGAWFEDVVGVYVFKADRPDLAVKIAGQDIDKLSYIARILGNPPQDKHGELAEQVQGKLLELLERRSAEPEAPGWVFARLADMYRQRDDKPKAIKLYQRAVAIDYGKVNWRLDLARLLAETGHISQAMDQARVCLRLRPQLEQARTLIEDLSIQPAAFDDDMR